MTFNYAKTKLYCLGVILAKLFSLNSFACLEQTYNQVLTTKFLQPSSYNQVLTTKFLQPSSYNQVLTTKFLQPSSYNQVPRIKFLQSIFYKLIEFYQNKSNTPKPQIYPLKELKL